ncbi:hypothetical protein [Chromobacterium vaccinii]|uniref:hypothetical protein n=1 Tax=Chromobacterium vaccinii TaxID=1108595 RepID=UPI0016428942|nr:hypothetical protein [Chromobacterium vaccinii]
MSWAEKNDLLVGRWSTVLAIGLATTATGKLFERHPAWVDQDGKLYGMLQVHQPPQITQPVAQIVNTTTKKPEKPHKTKRKSTLKSNQPK